MNQTGNLEQSRFGVGEGAFHGRVPGEILGRSFQSRGQRMKNLCSLMDKLPVEVDHSQEPLEGRTIHWARKLRDGGTVLLKRGGAGGGHKMTQELHLIDSKNTLVQVDCKTMISAELKDLLKVILMRNQIRRIDEDIV